MNEHCTQPYNSQTKAEDQSGQASQKKAEPRCEESLTGVMYINPNRSADGKYLGTLAEGHGTMIQERIDAGSAPQDPPETEDTLP